jgi:hypothetical protein
MNSISNVPVRTHPGGGLSLLRGRQCVLNLHPCERGVASGGTLRGAGCRAATHTQQVQSTIEQQVLLEAAPSGAAVAEMSLALVPRQPEMALAPRQDHRGQSQMDLLAAVSVKYPCQHQGCIKWALLSTNGERKYCITHMKEYGLAPWRKGCQHPECTKRAQTAITGEVLFCKVHMRLYGLLPKQKMCAHSGCTRVASASMDGKYLYCKTHMKEYGMMPKKDKKVCAHENCTKIAAATVDGEYKYCKSHMKEYGLQKRKYVKYCKHIECTKRAKRSSCGQWVYCRGHMRLYGMIPEGCKNNPGLLTGPQVVHVLEGPQPVLALPAPGHEHHQHHHQHHDFRTDGGGEHKDADEHLLYQPGMHQLSGAPLPAPLPPPCRHTARCTFAEHTCSRAHMFPAHSTSASSTHTDLVQRPARPVPAARATPCVPRPTCTPPAWATSVSCMDAPPLAPPACSRPAVRGLHASLLPQPTATTRSADLRHHTAVNLQPQAFSSNTLSTHSTH